MMTENVKVVPITKIDEPGIYKRVVFGYFLTINPFILDDLLDYSDFSVTNIFHKEVSIYFY